MSFNSTSTTHQTLDEENIKVNISTYEYNYQTNKSETTINHFKQKEEEDLIIDTKKNGQKLLPNLKELISDSNSVQNERSSTLNSEFEIDKNNNNFKQLNLSKTSLSTSVSPSSTSSFLLSNQIDKKEVNDTRELDNLTDINSSDNIDLLDEEEKTDTTIPKYKLRAETDLNQNNICDWVKAPALYIDQEEISELTNEQIRFTLDYFILSGYRVSQMTKTYYDIEAVTKLLDEKEKDLELAATIGKQLLEKDQQLEVKIEFLELQLEKTSEMVNQLRHEITLKDDLLKSFIESENDAYLEYEANELNGLSNKGRNMVNVETLNEYKKKINFLENENEHLRNKADYFEKETKELESKESVLIQNCVNELESTKNTLKSTQNELKLKTAECRSQQEQIQNLFAQIFELQQKVKTLKKDNSDLENMNESSIATLLNQLTDLKEKYNECLSILAKTQEELSSIRYRNQQKEKTVSVATLTTHSFTTSSFSNDASTLSNNDEEYLISNNNNFEPINKLSSKSAHSNQVRQSSSLYSPWMPNNSLAAELYSTLNKDLDKTYLFHQAAQSSEFIKQVKQKLSSKIPGSSFEQPQQEQQPATSNQSNEQTPTFHKPFPIKKSSAFSCQTPDSMLSTGSASIYSNIIGRSSSSMFLLPEKLQIVKPIEGSQTLQHWQHLARPNLGCLFESRPGVSVVALKSDSDERLNKINDANDSFIQTPKILNNKNNNNEDEFDDGVNFDYHDLEDDIEEDDENFDYNHYFFQNKSQSMLDDVDDDFNLDNEEMINYFSRKTRVLSPSKVQLLTRLLENEERNQNSINNSNKNDDLILKENDIHTTNDNIFTNFFRSISTRYFKSNDNIKENSITQETNNNESKKKRNEYDDPDTPPSSPINLPNSDSSSSTAPVNNVLFEVFQSAKLKCRSYFYRGKLAPTPPGTPTAGIELENYLNSLKNNNENNQQQELMELQQTVPTSNQNGFFDQIINKLNVFSSFNRQVSQEINKNDDIYPVNKNNDIMKELDSDEDDESDKEIEEIFQSINNNIKTNNNNNINTKCSTPPPSPTNMKNFSPPLPDYINSQDEEEYDAETLRKSAFVKLATLNPHINKSIDLSTLLGSLTSLKRTIKLYNNF